MTAPKLDRRQLLKLLLSAVGHLVTEQVRIGVPQFELSDATVHAHTQIADHILAGDARVGAWQLVLQAKLWSEVLVARSVLRRGQPLVESDFLIERRDVLAVRGCFPAAEVRAPGLELVENLNAGAPLLQRSVRMRPLICNRIPQYTPVR